MFENRQVPVDVKIGFENRHVDAHRCVLTCVDKYETIKLTTLYFYSSSQPKTNITYIEKLFLSFIIQTIT